MKETIRDIIDIEWKMFRNVNGDERVDCQDERPVFEKMRNAQFITWSDEAIESYLDDLKTAEASGQSLLKEKYIRMMECSDPEGFRALKDQLPALSEEKIALTEEIWQIMLAQTLKLRDKFPLLALGGRPLYKEDERGWSSIETYQKSELLTYSEKTLRLLLKHIKQLEERGIDIVYKIQENSVTCLGYKDMSDAEMAMAAQFMDEMGLEFAAPECSGCDLPEE
jgi:hypothetical protein